MRALKIAGIVVAALVGLLVIGARRDPATGGSERLSR